MKPEEMAETIKQWIASDSWMMTVIRTAHSLELPDWCVCAGFIRSKVWDQRFGSTQAEPINDIDVVYFDPDDLDERTEKGLEATLRDRVQGEPWSVKNQARMHLKKGDPPYQSTADALSRFPETCTAVGVRMEGDGSLELIAPLGVRDLWEGRVCPTPHFASGGPEFADIYERRIAEKNWLARWPGLDIVHMG